jgi:GNAT superfamily N-acetyltransferase
MSPSEPAKHQTTCGFEPVSALDFEALLGLRLEAMRESLERVGRYDPARSRERFRSSFEPAATRWITIARARVGFMASRLADGALQLDHLYILPAWQGRGIGAQVLGSLFAEADAHQLPVQVGALRESASNRFYQRHGFVLVKQDEWDLYYTRAPKNPRGPLAP